MCTVIAWNGQLPKGLLTSLLIAAEVRGRDSTGVAWRDEEAKSIRVHKQAVEPRIYVEKSSRTLGEARRVAMGIAHTRRASSGMPVDSDNAHPFVYRGFVYAHNGKIDNWKELRDGGMDDLLAKQGASPTVIETIKAARTDSQVLGPYIKERDFTPVVGCAGLVWLNGPNVYCFRTQKELAALVLTWVDTAPDLAGTDQAEQQVCIVASTLDIIHRAVSRTKTLALTNCAVVDQALAENTVYRVTQSGCVSEGVVSVNPNNHADAFTSGATDSTLDVTTTD